MPQQHLKQTLQSLHDELSRSPDIDPELRGLLTRLAGDIDDVLHPATARRKESESDESLGEQVRGAREQFEKSHPKLAAIIGQVADGLAQLGI